jgi:hypothetical protein
METGTFQDGQLLHHVGRAVFVFAGGTATTMADFTVKHDEKTSRNTKKPDFMSRLRGFLDVAGPDKRGEEDTLYIFRRAVLLFSILEQHAPHLKDRVTQRFVVDPTVLDALLFTAKYRHGARSMAALIRMSDLSTETELRAACFPHEDQLQLHLTNVDDFLAAL